MRRNSKLSIVSFAKEMKLALTKKSDNFYVEGDDDGDRVDVEDSGHECMICCCNDNEVIVKPCGHSGFCKACMVTYVKKERNCPFCKEDMDTLIIFYYDVERDGNFSKEAIKLS